ncbi:hypothetical protein ADUPG1_009428 [Aduncisulcus paluster]|uniref:Uncharacterized protein n=1 Tax=Aduncisulcus paluster TaxID=2918883 RepID=A0ABQ5KYD5_9EUKA|nr:hypothetical protein ADUPG1_009428 [Aduncisulcus paluster]
MLSRMSASFSHDLFDSGSPIHATRNCLAPRLPLCASMALMTRFPLSDALRALIISGCVALVCLTDCFASRSLDYLVWTEKA